MTRKILEMQGGTIVKEDRDCVSDYNAFGLKNRYVKADSHKTDRLTAAIVKCSIFN